MANPFEVNEDSSFTIHMNEQSFAIQGRGTITAKQQKREVGTILKAAAEALSDIRQDDMAEFFMTAGKQLVGRGGGRKPKAAASEPETTEDTNTKVAISEDDAVDNTSTTAEAEDDDDDVTETAPVITSSPSDEMELEDTGFEEVV